MEHEDDSQDLAAQVEKLTQQVEELRKLASTGAPPIHRQRPFQIVVGVFAVAIGILFYLVFANAGQAKNDVEWARAETHTVRQMATQAQNGAIRLESRVQMLEARPVPRPAVPEVKPHVPQFSTVVRSGKVKSVTGDAPVAKGDTCTLSVKSAYGGSGLNCRAHLRCGDKVLYGKGLGGFLVCNIDDGKPTFARDEDPSSGGSSGDLGDPRFELDLPKNRAVVSDGPTPEFSVEVALEVR